MTPTDNEPRRFELFWRNPFNYYRELLNCGEFDFCWDAGTLTKMNIEPVRWANVKIGQGLPWRQYVIGRYFTQEFNQDCKPERPRAVYPTWFAKEPLHDLIDYIENPWGSNAEYCTPAGKIDISQRPVFGQPHRVFISGKIDAGTTVGRDMLVNLSNLQAQYPQVELFLHGTSSYATLFGMNFRAGSYGPRNRSQAGDIILPNGVVVPQGDYLRFGRDIRAVGWEIEDLNVPSERCEFNITTARHAAIYWNKAQRLTHAKSKSWVPNYKAEHVVAEDFPLITTDQRIPVKERKEGDMLSCNHCSLWRRCSMYREGMVCSVAGSEGKNLADHFGSGNSKSIIKGLESILQKRASRVDKALQDENFDNGGELDPNVDKMMTSLFKDGVQLARLIDPSRSKPLVQVNQVNGISAAVPVANGQSSDARGLAATAISEIEASGVPRESITEQMIDDWFHDKYGEQQAIEAPIDAQIVEE